MIPLANLNPDNLSPETRRRTKRSEYRIIVSTSWDQIYADYHRLTGKEPPESQKTRWRRSGKRQAIIDLDNLAKSKDKPSGFAWGAKYLGAEIKSTKTLDSYTTDSDGGDS